MIVNGEHFVCMHIDERYSFVQRLLQYVEEIPIKKLGVELTNAEYPGFRYRVCVGQTVGRSKLRLGTLPSLLQRLVRVGHHGLEVSRVARDSVITGAR
jgi:hypothetical protein